MTKTKLRPLALLLVGLLWTSITQAQESVNASGGDGSGSGGSVAYSIGQIVYTTVADSSGSIAQGVQHTYEIYTVGIKETVWNISLKAFPNPTSENLTLQISEYNNEKLSYHIYDIQGKQLNSGQIVSQQTHISMNSLPSATYFINVVTQDNRKVQSFKIIKN